MGISGGMGGSLYISRESGLAKAGKKLGELGAHGPLPRESLTDRAY